MRYLDVCSGISAPTAAWKPLGWEAACFAEIEAAPRAVLAHHYPDVPLRGDFTEIKGDEYGPVDLLVGGTPCQDFSIAGLRAGLDGERGNLSLEYLRLADRARPRWLVWENVPGVLSIDGGRAFGAILGGLAELGYGFAYRVLDAQHFGVPQRRRRVFVVGYLRDWRRAAAVLFERHSLSGHPAPRREKGARVTGCLSPGAHPGGFNGQDAYEGKLIHCDDISRALTACHTATGRLDPNEQAFIAHSLRGEGFDASEDGTGRGTPLVPISFTGGASECISLEDCAHPVTARNGDPGMVAFDTTQMTSRANRSNPKPGDPCHPLAASAHPPAVAFTTEQTPKFSEDGALTLTKQSPSGGGQPQCVMAASAVRRLTPRECERLQGFPDDFTLVPYRKGMMADGPRYKMLGNSMAVPVVRWIGGRIAAVDAMEATS